MNRAARRLIDNVRLNRGRLVGHLYLGSTLTESVSRWPDNSPNNVGHRRDLIAVGVLLDRAHAWLLKGIDEHLWERTPSFLLTLRSPGIGNGLERLRAFRGGDQPERVCSFQSQE